ncbi:MAG: bifunctional riboflavin kinase/FAD synthetase [Wenzhouxiangellaceae bacterium]|nr:bifunctional riboflavin kinase/FAD synthetase [Wenzhouxiangellaceae bacterium]
MRVVRHLPAPSMPDAAGRPRRLAVAIGNFDGLHLGHQALIRRAVDAVPAMSPAVLCFEPLPRTFFAPANPVPRVMKLRDRADTCARLGVELLAQLRFDRTFSRQSPEQFARNVLADGLRTGRVVVGADFRFGHRAAGDVAALEDFGRRFGFDVEIVPEVLDADGERVSSSRLRQALADGELALAGRLLGRPYAISGRVVRGNRLGRTLGFPTANLRVAEPPALSGIAAVRVTGDGLERHPGVASLGRRPVIAGRDWLLEVHLFDFDGDLYGRHLKVEFVEHLRPERHFGSLEAMTGQMRRDAERAKAVLGNL